MKKERYNIGLAVADIMDPFSNRLARGAMKAAEKLDADLVILPGKYVGKDIYSANIDSKFEYQHNALFSYAANGGFDYLIVATGTIAHALESVHRKKMLSCFGTSPILSVAAKVDGFDYLLYDNRNGIIQAIDNLVNEQGRKHIGMMIGDPDNYECVERYNAYREGLEKNGLEFRESYCMECDLSENISADAERLIVLNPELDAIMCANDIVGAAVYEALRKHGKHIGVDISVVGFDDLEFSEKLEPPLATIRADAVKLGYAAVQKAVNYLNGINDDTHYVDTEFIPRQSCYGQADVIKPSDFVFKGPARMISERFADYFVSESDDSDRHNELIGFADLFMEKVNTCLVAEDMNESDYTNIVNSIDKFFNRKLDIVNNITKVQDIIDSAYRYLTGIVPDSNKEWLRRLYIYFNKRVSLDIVADYHTLEKKYSERVHFDNIFIRDTLMTSRNINENYARMLRRLALIGADTSFVYVLKEPVVYRFREIFPADIEWLFMGYVYGEDTYPVPSGKQAITGRQLFKNEYLNANRRHTLVAADLYSAEYQYGMLLCEPSSPDFFEELELVSYQLSAVVKTLHLRDKQEKTFMELHTKSLALGDVSKTDELTGLYNLRGFYEEAGKMVSDENNADTRYIVCYADMNDLKMVNERYGHEEGDYSLTALANCLKELFGNTAVAGRISGDEFAVIVPAEDVGKISDIQNRKKDLIQKLNFDSTKPYLITMSIGMVECECKDSYDLKAFVDKAYGILCEVKSEHKRNSARPD